MTSLPDNILHLPEYPFLGTKMEGHDLHCQVEAPEVIHSKNNAGAVIAPHVRHTQFHAVFILGMSPSIPPLCRPL